MNDSVKSTGLWTTVLLSLGFAYLGDMTLAYSCLGVFGMIIGFPIVGRLKISK